MYPEFANRSTLSLIAHPGTVTFVGPDGTERVERADQLPDWLKFAPDTNGATVPVVRVVRVVEGKGYSLRSYAADGQLVWVGTSVPVASPAEVEKQSITNTTARNSGTSRQPAQRPEPRRPLARTAPTGWF